MSVAVLRLRAGQTSRVRVEFHRRSAGRAASFGWGRLTPAMTRKALREIADADAVVVCAGFNSCSETEGRDRTFELPDGQDDLIRRAVRANPRCVVVLNSGGGVDMRAWLDGVPALVQAWYPGQNGNLALGEILFGDLSPSGKLPATFEKRWEDNPVHGTYPPVTRRMPYREGVFIGYRHYDARDIEPQFCFGHGLSYTAFRYSDLRVRTSGAGDDFRVCASARIANVGRRAGAEVVQLYVAAPRGPTPRPPRELKGFARVSLKPGECREVRFELGPEALSFYDPDGQRWAAEPGACEISLAASSRDVRLRATAVPPG
jgi:beta-glucosidase